MIKEIKFYKQILQITSHLIVLGLLDEKLQNCRWEISNLQLVICQFTDIIGW